jgi:hypothetical protein
MPAPLETPVPKVTFRESNRRYRRLFWPIMIFYSVFCFAGPAILASFADGPPRWLMALVAVISGAPIAGVFWLLGRFLRETDEYTRQIQTQAMLTGGAITFSLAVIWAFLELYQVVPRPQFFPSMMMVGPFFFMFYGLSFAIQHKLRGGSVRDLPCTGLGGEQR